MGLRVLHKSIRHSCSISDIDFTQKKKRVGFKNELGFHGYCSGWTGLNMRGDMRCVHVLQNRAIYQFRLCICPQMRLLD